MAVDLARQAWQALLRLDPPEPAIIYGDREDRERPAEPPRHFVAHWYQLGFEAQAVDVSGPLSRYPAHWVLDDDLQTSEYHGPHDDRHRVMSLDVFVEEDIPFEEDASTPWASDSDLDNHDDPGGFLASVTEVAGLTKRERQVASWIAEGNAVFGVDYAERLSEAVGCTPSAARKVIERLRVKLVDHWAS